MFMLVEMELLIIKMPIRFVFLNSKGGIEYCWFTRIFLVPEYQKKSCKTNYLRVLEVPKN